MKTRIAVTSAITIMVLAGCAKHDSGHNTSAAKSEAGLSSTATNHSQKSTNNDVQQKSISSKPNLNTKLSDYIPMRNNNDLMYQYYAHYPLPPEYKKIASNLSEEYAETSDVFKKRSILKKLKPIIDQKISYAKSHPYIIWPASDYQFHNYSFKRKGFSIDMGQDDSILTGAKPYWDDGRYSYELFIKNYPDFDFIKVENEATAKTIEKYLSRHSGQLKIRIFAYVDGASLSSHYVKAVATDLQIIGQGKKVILNYRPTDPGSYKKLGVVCVSMNAIEDLYDSGSVGINNGPPICTMTEDGQLEFPLKGNKTIMIPESEYRQINWRGVKSWEIPRKYINGRKIQGDIFYYEKNK